MKRRIMIATMLALCLCLLAGCGCKHEWAEADCVTAKTCTLCGEVEGEALGHSWQDATCEAPETCTNCGMTEGDALGHSWETATCEKAKTCSVCGSAEGDALGHSYGKWVINEETMSRACEICGSEETTEIDRAVYLADQLIGRWDCTQVEYPEFDMVQDPEYVYDNAFPYMEIGEDCTIHYFNGTEHFDGTIQFAEYVSESGLEAYYFYGMQDGSPQMFFAFDVTPGEVWAVYAIGQYANLRYELESEETAMMRQALVGTWNAIEKRIDGESGSNPYTGCTITYRDDHSFSATMDGVQFEGFWRDPDFRETDVVTIYDYWIQYPRDNWRAIQLLRITIDHEGRVNCIINFDNEFTVYFEKE